MQKMERMVFLKKFLQNPKSIGSLTPSSSFLTLKMMENLSWEKIDAIAELGAGTGTFTKYVEQYKKHECKYLVVEQDKEFQYLLKSQYPDLILANSAETFIKVMKKNQIRSFDCVISGLPFANFDNETQDIIIKNIYNSLKPDGIFVMFQYSLQMHNTLQKYFSNVDVSFVLLNFPPAFVYHCKK